MTIDTSDEALTRDYQHFISEIQPKLAPFSDALNKKLVQNEFTGGLQDEGFKIYLNKLKFLSTSPPSLLRLPPSFPPSCPSPPSLPPFPPLPPSLSVAP